MSGNQQQGQQQQQQNQKGGNQQKPAQTGLSVTGNIAPADITNPESLSNTATLLGGAAALTVAIRWIAPHVKKFLFGIDSSAGVGINHATPNDIVNAAKTKFTLPNGQTDVKNTRWAAGELMRMLPKSEQDSIISSLQPKAKSE